MGVEYNVFCHNCKEYIDCHKIYGFWRLYRHATKEDEKPEATFSNFSEWGEQLGYWHSRAIWFLLRHFGHKVEMMGDCDDDVFYELEGRYKEVSSYREMKRQQEAIEKQL